MTLSPVIFISIVTSLIFSSPGKTSHKLDWSSSVRCCRLRIYSVALSVTCVLQFQYQRTNTICEKNKEALRHDIIFFSHWIISSTGSLLASEIFTLYKIHCNYPLPPRKVTALQVVRTSFLGTRPRLFPPVDQQHPKAALWLAIFASMRLFPYRTTETITTKNSMRPKRSASFASLERIERRCGARIQFIVPCVGEAVCLIFVALTLDFINIILKKIVWDLFYSLKQIGSSWMFVVTSINQARCHTRFMSAGMSDGKFSLILTYFFFAQLM